MPLPPPPPPLHGRWYTISSPRSKYQLNKNVSNTTPMPLHATPSQLEPAALLSLIPPRGAPRSPPPPTYPCSARRAPRCPPPPTFPRPPGTPLPHGLRQPSVIPPQPPIRSHFPCTRCKTLASSAQEARPPAAAQPLRNIRPCVRSSERPRPSGTGHEMTGSKWESGTCAGCSATWPPTNNSISTVPFTSTPVT